MSSGVVPTFCLVILNRLPYRPSDGARPAEPDRQPQLGGVPGRLRAHQPLLLPRLAAQESRLAARLQGRTALLSRAMCVPAPLCGVFLSSNPHCILSGCDPEPISSKGKISFVCISFPDDQLMYITYAICVN